uniref:Uncharacterized protein n=1 Tax=Pseudomonas syringae pv. cerasicola TaxID=264451 RepID=A0A330JXI6_PSESX|nr:hypothetical protein PSCFBP6110_P100067 [Pseudomonas syringae pv. cerasicola]SPD89366.1 hypothetical protein PSCFBP6110_P100091 [Pseudomonas syringae pv. cerasicola]
MAAYSCQCAVACACIGVGSGWGRNDTLSFSPLGQRYSPVRNTCAQPTGKDMRQELGRHIKLFISLLWGSNHKPPEFPSDELTFTLHTPGC